MSNLPWRRRHPELGPHGTRSKAIQNTEALSILVMIVNLIKESSRLPRPNDSGVARVIGSGLKQARIGQVQLVCTWVQVGLPTRNVAQCCPFQIDVRHLRKHMKGNWGIQSWTRWHTLPKWDAHNRCVLASKLEQQQNLIASRQVRPRSPNAEVGVPLGIQTKNCSASEDAHGAVKSGQVKEPREIGL